MEEKLECPECGKLFGEEETLEEHFELEHDSEPVIEEKGIEIEFPDFRKYWNRSLSLGFLVGILMTAAAFSGFLYWDSMDHRQKVPITVVTCDNCTYQQFRTATDRMFRAEYNEVDYDSEEGQRLIQKYNLKHIPGFIFDGPKLEKAENFTRVRNSVVSFEDAYVIPDEGAETAQRLSKGFELEQGQ